MECKVTNANYERVVSTINRFLADGAYEVCCCSRCVSDIAAIALNNLAPHYYVDSETDKEAGSPMMIVEAAVVEAIERVQEQPNHA
jgi:hypothetical protein